MIRSDSVKGAAMCQSSFKGKTLPTKGLFRPVSERFEFGAKVATAEGTQLLELRA